MRYLTLKDNLTYLDDTYTTLYDINSLDDFIIMSSETAELMSSIFCVSVYKLLEATYGIHDETNREEVEKITESCFVIGSRGYSSYKRLEKSLLCHDSKPTINFTSSKYYSGRVISEFNKPYGSDILISGAEIKTQKIRNDKRVFGLKYAKPGIYHKDDNKKLIYMDFKNFYPNILMEYGGPNMFNTDLFKKMIDHGGLKSVLNKLIGRFDAEYSLFYDISYANNLRKFGRLKLMYYIDRCNKLLLCNTDSILAYVGKDFEIPDGVEHTYLESCLIKNIGNYVLTDNVTTKTTGIFNKQEELVIASERMGYEQPDYKYSLKYLFGIDKVGYISSNDNEILGFDRKIRYGYSDKLNKKSLISIQENI